MAAVGGVAVAEGSVGALLAVGLLGLLYWVVLRGTLAAYEHTFGAALQGLATALNRKVLGVRVDFGGPVRALDRRIREGLYTAAADAEHLAGRLFHAAALVQEWTTRELVDLANETLALGQYLVHRGVPKVAKWAILAAFPPALLARLIAGELRKLVPKLVRVERVGVKQAGAVVTRTYALPYHGQWAWLHRHWRALTRLIAVSGALVGGLALPHVNVFPRLRALERWEGLTKRRLRRLERLFAVSVFAASMAAVLGLKDWRCLTRGNIGRTARMLCGLDGALLGALLAGLGLLAVPFSIEALGREYLAIEEDLVGLVTGAISELDGIG